jgi:hypothetical protein
MEGLRSRIIIPFSADGWARVLGQLFELATAAVGKTEARRLFIEAAKQGRDKGKNLAQNRDAIMLRAYEIVRDKGVHPRRRFRMAVDIVWEFGGCGSSKAGIEKRLRGLVAAADRRKEAQQREAAAAVPDDDDLNLAGRPLMSGLFARRPKD